MRILRSQLKKAAGGKLIPFHVYATRTILQITEASPSGTFNHMQANVMAVSKEEAAKAYRLQWPRSTVIRVFGPDEPMKWGPK